MSFKWGVWMNKLYEKFRINSDKALLGMSRGIYDVTGGRFWKTRFTKTVDIRNVGTDVKIISENEDSVTIAKVDSNGNIIDNGFRILSTTDLHLGDDPEKRKKCIGMLMKHIADTKPDLVILTGDIILGKYQHLDSIEFAQFMEKVGVYWAFVFGNHEAREEKGRFKELLMKCQTSFPHCIARQGRKDLFGLCNYCINIMKSENEVLKTLFLFDSGRNILDEYRKEQNLSADVKGYDYLKKNQMDWYEEKLSELRKKYGKNESFMYMHIPLKEYENVIYEDENGGFPFTGKCEVLYGSAFESIGSSSVNSGMFELIKKHGSTQAVFAGHDHVNDFCAIYDGIYLVYNQCGGYETYTMFDIKGWDEKEWMQGVTVTDIKSDGKFDISPRYNRMYL